MVCHVDLPNGRYGTHASVRHYEGSWLPSGSGVAAGQQCSSWEKAVASMSLPTL